MDFDRTNKRPRSSVCFLSTPSVAVDTYQKMTLTQNRTNWFYISTIQAAKPNYVYQYKSGTERIQALMGRLSQGQNK